MEAHRGVLPSTRARSTVNEVNLPSTCVSCHRSTAVAVSGTIHQILAEAGDVRTPTCVTCHGLNVSQMPSPSEMERQCASCHRPGSPRAAYPAAAREVLEAIASLRASADALGAEIATVSDGARRAELTARLLDTQAALKDASAAFHQFRPAAMSSTLDRVRQRLADLAEAHASAQR
jgi:chorismate synthase